MSTVIINVHNEKDKEHLLDRHPLLQGITMDASNLAY